MFFTTNNNPNFQICYTTERPYTDLNGIYYDPKKSIFLPTVLTDLKQIVTACTDPSYNFDKKYYQAQADYHIQLRNMCIADGIIGKDNVVGEEGSRWDSYIDRLLSTLDNAVTNQGNEVSQILKLAYDQLMPSGEVIKKAVFHELQAYHDEMTLFWRYSNHGYIKDAAYEKENTPTDELPTYKMGHDYGDSLFSGYIKDGMFNSDFRAGINNYGACVFSYYDIHRQGIKVKEQGYVNTSFHTVENTEISDLPSLYQDYLNNLREHQLYTIKYNNEEINKLEEDRLIYIPKNTISSSALYQSGEEFHPALYLTGDLSNVDVVLQG